MGRATRRRRKFGAKQRAEIVEAYRQSGLSQREFCTQQRLGLSTLQLWLRKSARAVAVSTQFLELPPVVSAPTPRGMYRVHLLQGTVVEIASGFRSEELRALLQLLSA